MLINQSVSRSRCSVYGYSHLRLEQETEFWNLIHHKNGTLVVYVIFYCFCLPEAMNVSEVEIVYLWSMFLEKKWLIYQTIRIYV